jgi:signal transduction histidine kinase
VGRRGYRGLAHALSIRQRLAVWYAGLLCLTLLLFSVTIYSAVQHQLLDSIQVDIQSRAVAIAGALERAQQDTGNGLAATPAATPAATATSTATATPAPTARADATPPATPPATEPTVTPIPTPNTATSAAIQKQLTLTVPQILGRLDFGFEVLDSRGAPQYFAPSLNGVSLPLDEAEIAGVLHTGQGASYSARAANRSLLAIYVAPVALTARDLQRASATPAGSALLQASPGVSPAATGAAGAPGTATPAHGSGQAARIVGVVLVARPLDDMNGTLATLRQLLLIGDILAVVFVSLGGWLIATGGLRPLTAVTRTAQAIATHAHGRGLGERVRYRGPRDEVGTLAATFNEMLQALERVVQAQRRFVADASHELRAPLTTIQGTLEFLLRRAPPDLPASERTVMLEDAYAEVERLTSLINDLLLLARADAAASGSDEPRETWLGEQARGRREPVELDQVAMEVFRRMRTHVRARHQDIQIAVSQLEPIRVLADPGHLRQLALILLDNAIKYTPAGGSVEISVARHACAEGGASRGQSRAAFQVRDTGIGIAPESMPYIFERFYRGDRARVRDERGSGLGLAIAKWIVDAHQGEIVVESQPGAGARFLVLLPEYYADA